MRILRAFRLLRVVEKIGDLQKIVIAVSLSIVPTLQALVRANPLLSSTPHNLPPFSSRSHSPDASAFPAACIEDCACLCAGGGPSPRYLNHRYPRFPVMPNAQTETTRSRPLLCAAAVLS